MRRIGVVGLSWRSRHGNLLNELTISREEREARLPRLAQDLGVPELVYLATCNRVEVAFAREPHVPLSMYRRRVFSALTGRAPVSGEAEHTLKAWQGEGAVEHLFLVAAGLDSARVGESEIAGQLRDAVDLSRSLGLTGSRLDPIFAETFKVAKRVRPMTEGKIGRVSLAQVAARVAKTRLDTNRGTVALVGLSPMTMQCAEALAAHGAPLLIVNRTEGRAADYAATIGARHQSLEQFRQAPEPVSVVILATGATEPVLRCADLERLAARAPLGESPLIIDMGVPPNVTPADAAAADVPRMGMEEITEAATVDRERVLLEFSEARAVVDDALTDLRRQMADRLVGPMIAELRRRYRHTAMEGVDRLLEKQLEALGEPQREAVRSWAETLSRRFAHLPAIGLRELAFRVGPAAVEAFFDGVDPQLARELHEAADRAGLDGINESELEIA